MLEKRSWELKIYMWVVTCVTHPAGPEMIKRDGMDCYVEV